MQDWIPRPAGNVDPRRKKLTVEEGFVLSRLDGVTPASRLVAITGMPAERLRGILARLVSEGLVQRPPARAKASTPPPLDDAAPTEEYEIPQGIEVSQPTLQLTAEDILREDSTARLTQVGNARNATPKTETGPAKTAKPPPSPPAPAPDAPQEGAPLQGPSTPDALSPDTPAGAEPQSPEAEAAELKSDDSFRALFEKKLHKRPVDERVALARTASDAELSALCFDPTPLVIKSVLQHPRVGLSHARLIARHHRNPIGLEALVQRAAFAADVGVRRWLARNPQLPAGLFRRLWSGRRMVEHHKLAVDRDVPEQTRRAARELLRLRFANGPAEEKVELIVNTEGRVLGALAGLPLDGKTTSLLCGKTYRSTLLIQNLARWSATPPLLIACLLKQDAVRRSPSLRTMLLRHPNTPSHAKQRDE